MAASPTITTTSPQDGGPRIVTGYFTANGTTTAETMDLSTYGEKVKFAVSWIEHDLSSTPAFVRATSFSTTGYTVTVTHTAVTTTSAVVKFLVAME